MGFFSKRDELVEPSHSRRWISQNGQMSRKNVLAVAVLSRLTAEPVGAQAAWGNPLAGSALDDARAVVAGVVAQDCSLARHVARDVTLMFESFGGLAVNHRAALESVGLADCRLPADPGRANMTAAGALAVARTIQARSQGGAAAADDVAIYTALYEDRSEEGYEWALNIG